MTIPAFTATHDADNRVATWNSQNVTHDNDGNMTFGPLPGEENFVTYSFDARNRLTDVGGVTYQYDAENNRIAKTTADGETTYVFDPHGDALPRVLVRERPDESLTYYVYGIGLLYEVDEADNATYYHFDQSGSTIALTDDTGVVTDRVEYTPYGTVSHRTGTTDTPYLYAGQFGIQADPNGLLHMRARYYSPVLKRFINADPARFDGGMNWYAYANNSPLMFIDPSGHVLETAWDISNVGLGLYSLQDNVRKGKWGWAALDTVGLIYDGAAVAVPFLPAGASAGYKAARAGNSAVNSVQVGLDVARVAGATHDAARGVDASLSATSAGTWIHRRVASKVDGRLFNLDSTYMAGANGRRVIQPDLLGRNIWGDVTTSHPKAWSTHVNTYGHLGDGIPILYQRGVGVTNSTRLSSGAGILSRGLQQINNSFK